MLKIIRGRVRDLDMRLLTFSIYKDAKKLEYVMLNNRKVERQGYIKYNTLSSSYNTL